MKLIPNMKVPALELELLHGQPWSTEKNSNHYTLLIVYRGYHCPLCRSYLQDFQELQTQFNDLGVELIAVSADSRMRAKRSRDEWAVEKLAIGYGLTEEDMRRWNLFASQAIKDGEPDLFAEPALFLIRSDSTLFYASYSSMPFARPRPEDVLEMIRFVEKNGYPARGEVRAPVLAPGPR